MNRIDDGNDGDEMEDIPEEKTELIDLCKYQLIVEKRDNEM